MKKILGYLPTWSFYRLGQFINYEIYQFEKLFLHLHIDSPFTDELTFWYIYTMEKSYNIQMWSNLTKPF